MKKRSVFDDASDLCAKVSEVPSQNDARNGPVWSACHPGGHDGGRHASGVTTGHQCPTRERFHYQCVGLTEGFGVTQGGQACRRMCSNVSTKEREHVLKLRSRQCN